MLSHIQACGLNRLATFQNKDPLSSSASLHALNLLDFQGQRLLRTDWLCCLAHFIRLRLSLGGHEEEPLGSLNEAFYRLDYPMDFPTNLASLQFSRLSNEVPTHPYTDGNITDSGTGTIKPARVHDKARVGGAGVQGGHGRRARRDKEGRVRLVPVTLGPNNARQVKRRHGTQSPES